MENISEDYKLTIMKELSIEEKAKAYDEAKLRMSAAYNSNRCTIGFMNEIFPELKESEDEKIRKRLLEHCRKQAEIYNTLLTAKEYSEVQSWIAWLEKQGEHSNFRNKIQIGDKVTRNEDGILVNLSQLDRVAKKDNKQGEQKPTDKVEPKFKVGDWAVSPNGVYWHIDAIRDGRYQVSSDSGESADWSLDTNIYHRFTINDAKDGDVLVSFAKYPFIYNGKFDEAFVGAYCGLTTNNNNFEKSISDCCWAYNKNIIPATKERRVLLFQKMEESGYEWDAKKKEVKIIDWSKHIKYEPNGPSITKEHPTWSEEDEEYMRYLHTLVDNAASYEYNKKVKSFLKSLKERACNFDDGYKVGFSAAKYIQWQPSEDVYKK